MINDCTFSNVFYRITKSHVTIEESTHSFWNSTLHMNKINISTTLEDIEEAFVYRNIPFKNFKRCIKDGGNPMTLVTLSLVNSSDRTELLKSRLIINNKKKAFRDYINRERLILLAIKLVIRPKTAN